MKPDGWETNVILKQTAVIMKKVQLDRYEMALGVESYLKENAELFSANVPMVATASLLRAKISELQTHIALQLVKYKGITIEKKRIRKTLENKAFILASACCSYASAVGDTDFFNRCYYTKSALVHFKDMELMGICDGILREVNSHAPALLPYNVTAVMIFDFESAMIDFMDMAEKPREAMRKKAEATEKIESLLTEILEIIR